MDKISVVDRLFHEITELLPDIKTVDGKYREEHFTTNKDGTKIYSNLLNEVMAIADLFDQLYEEGTCQVDRYNDMFYVSIG